MQKTKKITLGVLLGIFAILIAGYVFVQNSPVQSTGNFSSSAADVSQSSFKEILRGRVTKVLDSEFEQGARYSRIYQTFLVKINNQEVEVVYEDQLYDKNLQEVKLGDNVVVGSIESDQAEVYVFIEKYRLPTLLYLTSIFVVLAVIFGRVRGFTSLIGLAVSAMVLIWFIAPNLLLGKNSSLVILVGSGIIAVVSMLLAHGFKSRTVISIISTIFTLIFSQVLAYFTVHWTGLTGGGSEEAFYLQQGFSGVINLRGLLLGGVVIGVLGILNDVTTSQSATVEEIFDANPRLSFKELYNKASSVGQEHIASLINTLVLVYAGASLPLFLLLTLNKTQPLWAIINSEPMAEEIVRTIVGSIALIVALPITTLLASWYFKKTVVNTENNVKN